MNWTTIIIIKIIKLYQVRKEEKYYKKLNKNNNYIINGDNKCKLKLKKWEFIIMDIKVVFYKLIILLIHILHFIKMKKKFMSRNLKILNKI